VLLSSQVKQFSKVCPVTELAYAESLHVKSLPLVLVRTLPHCTAHCEEGATSMAWAGAVRRAHKRRSATGATSKCMTAMKQL